VPSVTVRKHSPNNVDLAPSPGTADRPDHGNNAEYFDQRNWWAYQADGTVSLPTVLYARSGSENNHVYGQANVTGNVEAVDKFFFIDGAASVSQQYFSPFGAQPVGLSNVTQNRYTAQSYSVSPYIQGGTPSTVQYKLRDDNIWTNLTNTSADVALYQRAVGTVSKEYALGWAAEYNRAEVRFHLEFPQITQVGRLAPTLWIRRCSSLSPAAEDDDYVVSTFHSAIYGVGGSWRPTPRQSQCRMGASVFGASYLISATGCRCRFGARAQRATSQATHN
jgi:uncharacterized protein (PEP-CTERM system associated)